MSAPLRTLIRSSLAAIVAALLLGTALVAPASAHGSVSDPPSRNYGCWQRWGSDFQNPQMATLDPMCWQAWQADPNAMWNWNGLFREGVAGNHEGAIPDGTLCSGGHTSSGRYNSLDAVGAWRTVDKPARFTLNLLDQALHGADYIRVYATRQGFDPKTQPLRWRDLELVGQTGRVPTGATTPVEVNAPGRSGHHIVFTIWQASHSDQSYYFCSDVNFTGSTPTPTPTPTSTPTPTATPTPTPTPTPGPGQGCSATYRVTTSWSGGFQAEVRITAGSAAISGWTVNWTYTGGQTVSSAWNATVTSSAGAVTARNAGYNGSLGAGAATTFGFLGSGTPGAAPTLTCTAT
ncbi:lytic polysaccharide monooxygenase [Microbispora sp. NPDC049125]|uniref:lytic polysaccharide monooxygenase auxiliary activity family 9 protein n=1 Tax=Microbispora sp. NPDC049125 TaxID=3154929 RepID=UPI003465F754